MDLLYSWIFYTAAAAGDRIFCNKHRAAYQQCIVTLHSQTGKRKEKVYTDSTVQYGLWCSSNEHEPTELQAALANSNWKIAMDMSTEL
jgi:hypothetical protein